jgi:transglutaminase-like putative cysteine protease
MRSMMMTEDTARMYLKPTAIIDSDHPAIEDYVRETVGAATDPVARAVKLYLAVRDGIRYDPYSAFYLPEHYQASKVLERRRSFCIPKAALLCALSRAARIPARIGFADVRNHLATKQLLDYIGSDLFVYHGYADLFLEGKWVKATPAFNRELCERHHVPPLEFNGREDSLFHPYNHENRRFMEYVTYHGTHADVPVDEILIAWRRAYGEERIEGLIRMFTEHGADTRRDFAREEVYRG